MQINLTKMTEYVGEVSDQEIIQILDTVTASLTQRRQDLLVAWQNNDWSTCARLTHNLKSNALYIGADALHQTCQQGENLFRSPSPEPQTTRQWFDTFTLCCDQVLYSIDSVLKEKRHAQGT